jgi:hypothetical protein
MDNVSDVDKNICSKCGDKKYLTEFHRRSSGRLGVTSMCKVCAANYDKEYQKNNREKKCSISKKYYEKNKDKILSKVVRTDETRKKYNEWRRNKKINNPMYKLTDNVRHRLKEYLKITNIVKTERTFDIVGCTPPELKDHLEEQFVVGMSWDNHGYNGWHIDHIIPLSSAKTEEEIYKLSHYTNLQPMWGKDNIKKGNKLWV